MLGAEKLWSSLRASSCALTNLPRLPGESFKHEFIIKTMSIH